MPLSARPPGKSRMSARSRSEPGTGASGIRISAMSAESTPGSTATSRPCSVKTRVAEARGDLVAVDARGGALDQEAGGERLEDALEREQPADEIAAPRLDRRLGGREAGHHAGRLDALRRVDLLQEVERLATAE